jgi:hypothetical protein
VFHTNISAKHAGIRTGKDLPTPFIKLLGAKSVGSKERQRASDSPLRITKKDLEREESLRWRHPQTRIKKSVCAVSHAGEKTKCL